jgi:two-component system cell cycle sensor histidine kinase/response regulator CckA
MNAGSASGMTMEVVLAVAAALLVLGLCHLETLLSDRQASERAERRLRTEWESRLGEKTADLVRANAVLLRQIARLEQRESALSQSEADYCALFEENPQPMWVFDLRSLQLLAGNKAAQDQYGFAPNEFKGLSARDLLAPAAAARFLQDAARPCSGSQSRGVWQHRRKDGTLVEVEVTALDLHYAGAPARLVMANDISPRRQREHELCEAKRQDVVNRLAGGVAHHLNNTLTIVGGYTSLLLHRSQDQATVENLKRISTAVNCAAGLARQLLIASGQFALRLELVDLNSLIVKLEPMIRRLVGKDIVVQQSCAPDPLRILADVRMVEHIIVNLVLNARDAMPHRGTLTISTDLVLAEDCECERQHSATPRPMVRLAIRDTGCGISPEVEDHLFEPFFSTRGVGKGRGLGLASVQGAVTQQEGWIEYTTELGVGTEFRVIFPLAPPAPASTETDFRRWVRH